MADYLSSVLNEYGLGDKKDKEPSYLDSVLGEYGLTEPKKAETRNPFAVANDTVITAANAALGGVQAVSDFVAPGNKFSQGVEALIKEGEDKQSTITKQGRAKLGQALESEDIGTQLSGVKDFVLQNPLQAAAMAAGSFALPGGAIKGSKLLGGALGLSEKAAGRVALGTGMGTSGVLAGGDAAGDAYQTVMNAPELAGMPIDERERIATDAARKASAVPFVLGAASGMFGADKALATGTKSLLKTGLQEFASEAIEEGGTKLSANIAAQQAGVDVGTFKGVAGSAALGGVLGGGTGLAVGALTKQPDSFLAGSTNISTGNISPDNNAIDKAIDANSTEIDTNTDQQLVAIREQQAEIQQAQVQAKQEADAAAAQQAQAQAQEQQQQAQEDFKYKSAVYGINALDTANQYRIGNKQFFNTSQAAQFIQGMEELNQGLGDELKFMIGAAVNSGALKIDQKATPKSVNNAAVKFLSGYGLADATGVDDAVGRVEAIIKTLEGPKALKEADVLNNFYKSITGVNAPAFDALQTAAQPKLTQGVKDERLQLQNNAGLRAVSEQGGTTQASGNQPGDVRPTSVQPIQSGSVGTGSLGLQTGAVPSGRVPTSTSSDGSRTAVSGQVSGSQEAQVTSEREDAIRVVNQVITRAFGERDAKIVLEVLTKEKTQAQIAKEFGISDARVNQIAGPQAQETWGSRILLAARNMGISKEEMGNFLEMMSTEETVAEDQVVNEELLAEAPTEATSAQNVDDTNIATSDEDLRLGTEEVSTGEEGGPSGFRVFNPDVSGQTELEDASAQNRTRRKLKTTELKNLKDFELNNLAADENTTIEELDQIVAELLRRQEVRVAKGDDNAVQKQSTEGVSVRKQAEAGKRVPSKDTKERKAATESQADEEVSSLTLEEQAEKAWDKAAKEFPQAPKFADLTEDQQADFVSFGPDNWTADDVQTELIKLAKEEMTTPAKSVQKSFSESNPLIDPTAVEVDEALRGKTIKEAMNWALGKARNEYERSVLRAVDARLKELTNLGVEFSFQITKPGKQLTGGAKGVSIYTPAGLGESQKVDVILNGAHTGEMAGTDFETLTHELIHAVTQAQLKFAPDGSAAKELKALYNEVVAYYNKRAKAGTLNDWEKKFFKNENNSLNDPDELLSWGMTNKDFQEYLASINVTPKVTLWDKFVKLVSTALSIPVRSDSALGRLMSVSENLFAEDITPYVQEANKRFQSLGKQANTTKYPTWSLNADHGAPAWIEGDYALYKAISRTGSTIYLPGKQVNGTSAVAKVDVGSGTFAGNIPPSMLVKMQAAANDLRVQVSPSVKLVSSSLKKTREETAKRVAKLPKPIRGPLQHVADTIAEFAKKSLPFAAFTEDLADIATKFLPSAKKYVTLMKERQAIRTKFERRVDEILQKYDALPSEVKGTGDNSVNKFLMDSTRESKWAYNPGWIKGFKEETDIDAGLEARFKALPDSAQALVKEVFAHGQSTLLAMQKAVTENINTEYDALIAAAKKSGDTKEEAELTKKKASTLTEYATLMRTNSKKPYAPLKRFGNYVIVGKSQQYIDNEAIVESKTAAPDEVAEARKKLRELEKNDLHYFVQFAETVGEAKAIVREEAGNYDYLENFEKDSSQGYGIRDLNDVFNRLRNMVEDEKDSSLTDASDKAINRLLADLKLTLLSETSARNSERRRKNIGGAEKDMMRAFATQGRATANFISSLENSGDIYDTLREMKDEARKGTEGSRADRSRYYNEFMKRHFMGMDYQPSPFVDKALSTTSMWMLLTNPAYYLQNMTQPFMMSLPVIAGKHGYARSWKEMTRAYTDIASVIRKHGITEASYSKLPEDVRNVVEVLVNRGRIDISLEQDLGRWRSTEDSKFNKFGRATELLRSMAQDIETINRVATAVAAYRLEVKRGNPTSALNYADKIIYTTHGDYSGFNAPRITRSSLGRLATQFRKFQLIQISLMTRLFNDAFANEDPAVRMIGKKSLAFTVGHTAVMGGLMGLPGFYAIAALYGMLFGDKDEPDNPELALRRAIGDETIADLLVRGVPASLGVDLSGKLGMGQMLSALPYSDVNLSRKGVYETIGTIVSGPFGGLLAKSADGVSLMAGGDYQKGLEQLLPTGLANVAKAYRFGTEGVTTRAGDVVMNADDIGFVDQFFTALGLPTDTLTDRNFLNAAKFEYDQFYNDKASEIKRAYTRAYKEGDTAALNEAREAWKSLQESRARNGYQRQPLSNLLKAPQEQKKRERQSVGGVQFNKANRGFVRTTSEL